MALGGDMQQISMVFDALLRPDRRADAGRGARHRPLLDVDPAALRRHDPGRRRARSTGPRRWPSPPARSGCAAWSARGPATACAPRRGPLPPDPRRRRGARPDGGRAAVGRRGRRRVGAGPADRGLRHEHVRRAVRRHRRAAPALRQPVRHPRGRAAQRGGGHAGVLRSDAASGGWPSTACSRTASWRCTARSPTTRRPTCSSRPTPTSATRPRSTARRASRR